MGTVAASDDERVYLVPYKWWRGAKEAMTGDALQGVPYFATSASNFYGIKIINNLLGSDLVLHLRRSHGDMWQHGIGQGQEAGSCRSYALIRSDLWSRALKWYTNSDSISKNGKNAQIDEDYEQNSSYSYPLTLRISVMQEINLTIKITKKDNASDNYKRANKIFVDSEPVQIWDFSGQTNLILMNEMNKFPSDCCNSDQEILLEVQVFAMLGAKNKTEDQIAKSSSFNFTHRLFSRCELDSCEVDLDSPNLGLIGLENLGNTCFMNSAVQCLAHTHKLVEYFHTNYSSDINKHNPLGMKGEIALAFGYLLRRLWRSDRRPVAPNNFKAKLAHFAPQFSGFNQHDSQELLAFLLDGLHEDLNRVKSKPYSEAKDSDGRPDDEVADEYWENHLARNDSIIVDTCHGQYKSTLVCPICNKVSTTFDPFMYLSLPLPCTAKRIMTVTVLSTDGITDPFSCTITVPKSGTFSDFVKILGTACSLRDDETLMVAEVYKSGILRFLEEPSDLISLLRDDDRLAAYRVPKQQANASVVVFMHQKTDENNTFFGVPLVTTLPDKTDMATLRTTYLKLINPFLKKKESSVSDDSDWSSSNLSNCTDSTDSSDASDEPCKSDEPCTCTDLEEDLTVVITDDKGQVDKENCQSEEMVLSEEKSENDEGQIDKLKMKVDQIEDSGEDEETVEIEEKSENDRGQIEKFKMEVDQIEESCEDEEAVKIEECCEDEETISRIEVFLVTKEQTDQNDQNSQTEENVESEETRENNQDCENENLAGQTIQIEETSVNNQDGETELPKQMIQIEETSVNNQDGETELPKEMIQIEEKSENNQEGETEYLPKQTIQIEGENDNLPNQIIQTGGETDQDLPNQPIQTEQKTEISQYNKTENSPNKKRLHVVVQWSVRGLQQCDVSLLSGIPEIYKELPFRRRYRDQESATLYQCLDRFIKEEPLGPDDMWYCPSCKEHRQASKKLDLWRLPEILVIHLKRFQYNRYTKDKLETYVEFPIHDLDLSAYIAHRGTSSASSMYRLYAVSNHYGHLGGGHYTAYVYHEGEKRWFNFDDQFVRPVTEDNIKTAAAYVLFYRRLNPTN